MTRAEFTAAYREARRNLHIFAGLPSTSKHSAEERKAAEDRWIAMVQSPARIACKCLSDGLSQKQPTSNGALYAYRHGLYPNSSWPAWVRKDLARKAA